MQRRGFIAAAASAFVLAAVGLASACPRDGTSGPCRCAERAAQLVDKATDVSLHDSAVPALSLASGSASVQTVHVFNFSYSVNDASMPIMDATISLGDTVHWVWDSGSHDVHSVDGSLEVFASDFGVPEFTFDHTFTHVGTFWYYCTAHGFDNGDGTASAMAGVINVVGNAISADWAADADGNWSVGTNWVGGTAPNGVDHSAKFGAGISAPRNITVDAAQTVGTLSFDNALSYTISGPGTLTLDVSSGQAMINVSSGSHVISSPVVLNDNTTINVTLGGSLLSLTGTFSATGRGVTKTGPGVVQLENIRAAGLNISAGTMRIRAKGSPNSAAGASVVTSLSVGAGAQLDLTDNSLVVDYSGPVGTLVDDTRQNLAAGRLFSSAADALHRLGYKDTGAELDIKFSFAGDTNLDGKVDVIDLTALAKHWQQTAVWTGGDLNYDGQVDIKDLMLLATTWQQGVGNPLPLASLSAALEGVGLGGVSVPEPATAFAGICFAFLFAKRRG